MPWILYWRFFFLRCNWCVHACVTIGNYSAFLLTVTTVGSWCPPAVFLLVFHNPKQLRAVQLENAIRGGEEEREDCFMDISSVSSFSHSLNHQLFSPSLPRTTISVSNSLSLFLSQSLFLSKLIFVNKFLSLDFYLLLLRYLELTGLEEQLTLGSSNKATTRRA